MSPRMNRPLALCLRRVGLGRGRRTALTWARNRTDHRRRWRAGAFLGAPRAGPWSSSAAWPQARWRGTRATTMGVIRKRKRQGLWDSARASLMAQVRW